MNGRRFGAVVGAVLMIALAVFVRSKLDDDDSTSNGDGDLTIACVPELAEMCARLPSFNVRVEEPAKTIAALDAGESGLDGWLTFAPWIGVANLDLARDVVAEGPLLGASPLVIDMPSDRAAALAASAGCGGTISWRCLIDAAGRSWAEIGGSDAWGRVTIGLPPSRSASGLLMVGNAVSGYFGRVEFATNDLAADDGFAPWFAKLKQSLRPNDPYRDFVQQFPARFGAVGTTQITHDRNVGARRDLVTTITPEPKGIAVVVLAEVVGGLHSDEIAHQGENKELRDASIESGWGGGAVVIANLPDPGVLIHLRDR